MLDRSRAGGGPSGVVNGRAGDERRFARIRGGRADPAMPRPSPVVEGTKMVGGVGVPSGGDAVFLRERKMKEFERERAWAT